jgi:hypothetical protein
MYTSFPAADLLAELQQASPVKLIYDRDTLQYWEIKSHVARSDRAANKPSCNTLCLRPSPPYDIWSGFPDILSPKTYETNRITLSA